MGSKELCLIDNNITSLLSIALSPTVTSLNLHCNHIPRIESLASAWHLQHLDLSSNCISKIEGLSSLTSLKTLSLSCNLITTVEGLNNLVNLAVLNLSHNQINNLSGLLYLHGVEYKLKHISLHGNHLDNIDHLLQCLLGIKNLREVILNQNGRDNPICRSPGYREMVLQSLPQISVLDCVDQQGNMSAPCQGSLSDIPGLEDYMDLLQSSGSSHNEVVRSDKSTTTAHNEHVLTQFVQQTVPQAASGQVSKGDCEDVQLGCSQATDPADPEQRIKTLERQVSQLTQQAPTGKKPAMCTRSVVRVRKAKRDTDHTSESECDSAKENWRHTGILTQNRILLSATCNESKARTSDSDQKKCQPRTSKYIMGPRKKAGHMLGVEAAGSIRKRPVMKAKASEEVKTKSTKEEETYRTIVEERDQERDRRWKAEQAVRKLTEELKCLQAKVSEEQDLQSMAVHTTERLKDVLLKERSGRSVLQARVEELERTCQCFSQQLDEARSNAAQQQTKLLQLQESASHRDALRARQQDEARKQHLELKNHAAALKKELDIQRVLVHQHKDKVAQLHELLASREQEHRQQLALWLQPGEAMAKEVASAEQRHGRREAELQEKLEDGHTQYAALEDEFRMALTIEATRFSEVKEACHQMSADLLELKANLAQSHQKEKKSGSLVQELMVMVKEQKCHISEVIKDRKDTVAHLKRRLYSLETEVGQDKRLGLQLELLKKDKARLVTQLTAQESVIDGLRAERRIWGQELAQQGASLAQDRGRFEARIEALSSELDTQRKQNERDRDALKIQARIIDDQTETIRKLKEGAQEHEDQIRRLREDAVQAQKSLEQHLEEERAQQAELKEQVEQLRLRKQELKEQLEDKEAELEEVRGVYSDSSKKWQEKADLLTQLESQVKRMKEDYDSKERLLLEERKKATKAHKAAVGKLHCVDDAFRRQLEAIRAAHQVELLRLANEKQKEIDQANQKVADVEEEMRQLLEETETHKRIMEEKMKRLSSVLKDF